MSVCDDLVVNLYPLTLICRCCAVTNPTMPKLIEYLEDAALRCNEGLVFKRSSSQYMASSKKSSDWLKAKPDQCGHINTDIDAVVIGGYDPEGQRRAGGVSSFLLGVVDERYPGKVWPIGKVGSGYSDDELAVIRKYFDRDGFASASCPDWVIHPPGRQWRPAKDDHPSLWIPPAKSIVLTIHVQNVVECLDTKFPAGSALARLSFEIPSFMPAQLDLAVPSRRSHSIR